MKVNYNFLLWVFYIFISIVIILSGSLFVYNNNLFKIRNLIYKNYIVNPNEAVIINEKNKIKIMLDKIIKSELSDITMSVSDKSIATIKNNGEFSPIKPGNVDIIITDKDNKIIEIIDATILPENVSQKTDELTILAKKITLSNSILHMNIGDTYELKASISPSNTTSTKITWESSNNQIATVDSKGKITALQNGVSIITAKIDNIFAKMSVGVNMINNFTLSNEDIEKANTKQVFRTREIYTDIEADYLTRLLKAKITTSGYRSRNGVVQAANFLTRNFKSGIYYISGNTGAYNKQGLKITQSSEFWGDIKNNIKYGFNCSSFVRWALINGGFKLDTNEIVSYYNDNGIVPSYYLSNILKGTEQIDYAENTDWNVVKPGDIVWYGSESNGHVGIIIYTSDYFVYVAESANPKQDNGLIINKYRKKSNEAWKKIVLMDGFYNNSQNYY